MAARYNPKTKSFVGIPLEQANTPTPIAVPSIPPDASSPTLITTQPIQSLKNRQAVCLSENTKAAKQFLIEKRAESFTTFMQGIRRSLVHAHI